MKRKAKNRVLGVVLAAAMLLGNIGAPQGTAVVKASQVQTEGLTEITDEDIANLYHPVDYASLPVHDPSIIKSGDEYYVFGTQRGIAKTSNLREWTAVDTTNLFADENGNILSVDNAFTRNAFHGKIPVAATVTSDVMTNGMAEGETEEIETEETETETTETETTETEETETQETETADTEETETQETETADTEETETQETETTDTEETETQETEEAEQVTEETETKKASEETMQEPLEIEGEAAAEEMGAEAAGEKTEQSAKTVVSSPVHMAEAELTMGTLSAATENGEVTATVDFGSFDAAAWNLASVDMEMSGNLWAPDIVYNPSMNQYCMYLSLNGAYHNSVIVLLTANAIEGPYVYQGPVVYSGFSSQEDIAINWKNTDITYALGEMETLPERYRKITNVVTNEEGKITGANDVWGNYWPHAIDPCVFYDEADKLWMAYGSWSGGIYMLELDETTGLRDYTVAYESNGDTLGQSVTSDAYFGKKIAGGYYVSGEGAYIEKIGDYYYLFMSYGFYGPNGGYVMRIFRSENPDGPYVDTNGVSSVYDSFMLNYTASWGSIKDTRGMRLMTYYQWGHMKVGEVAQGHNSAFVDDDGRTYVIYHTKLDNNTIEHEVRVHELFQNKNGWILASPFAYAGDEALNYSKEPENVEGEYEIILTEKELGYGGSGKEDEGYTGELADITTVKLNSDGTVTREENVVGSWALTSGTPYVDMVLDQKSYSGVFAEVTKDTAGLRTMCFTVLDEAEGVTLWGARKLEGTAVIADNVMNPTYIVPSMAFESIALPEKTEDNVALYWESSNKDIISDAGVVLSRPAQNTEVTFTMTMVSGDYYYIKNYAVTVVGTETLDSERILVGTAYSDSPQVLSGKNNGSLKMTNPFYEVNTKGLSFNGGVSIEFDAAHTGDINVLGALLAFQDTSGGKLYFTQGSYLGYNAAGGYYDANLNNYTLVKDYIGEAIKASSKTTARVKINLNPGGFEVYVDNVLAYDQTILTTENGSASLTEYYKVLDWLQSAPNLYFGYGAWWSDSVNAEISNVEFYVNQSEDETAVDYALAALESEIPSSVTESFTLPVEGLFSTTIQWESSDESIITPEGFVTLPSKDTEVILTATVKKGTIEKSKPFTILVTKPETSNAYLERELLELKTSDQIEYVENPFYGKNLKQLLVSYDITWSEESAKNGWDSLFSFVNSTTGGRVSFQSNPYICYNEMLEEESNVFLDINYTDGNKYAENLEKGRKYSFDITLTKEKCTIYVDDELVFEFTSPTGTTYEDVLNYITECDKFTWGVGQSVTSFWWTEICTLEHIRISSNEYVGSQEEEVVLTDTAVEMENPLYGQKLQEMVIDFTVNYAEDAAMSGWESLMSFYGNEDGSDGRVSIQNAPYICYNSMVGPWLDINNVNNLVEKGMEVPVTQLSKGTDYHYEINIMSDKTVMKIDGVEIATVENSSGDITSQDILNYIAACKKFSWGTTAGTSFWGMEKCTIKDASIVGFVEEQAETEEKITVTFHYPDETQKEEEIKKDTAVTAPEYSGESGKDIRWYADEEMTVLWNFEDVVSEDMNLYGMLVYTFETSGISVRVIEDQQYTGKAIKPQVIIYDGATRLTEKTDYKVSYAANTKVGTAKITVTPCGNYDGAKKLTVNFKIVPREITEENVTISYKPTLNVKYNKKKEAVAQKQSVTLKYGSIKIPSNQYEISYMLNGEKKETLTEAGTYQMVITTKENSSFSGILTYDIVLTDDILIGALKITAKSVVYTGEQASTELTVKYKNKKIENLEEKFDIVYSNNVEIGTALVTLTAKAGSGYFGSRTIAFKITGTDIKKAAVQNFKTSMQYTGEEETQSVTLLLNKGKKTQETLTEGKDYTIKYTENVNVGKVTMTITGIGRFTGAVKKTYKITAVNLKSAATEDKSVTFTDSTEALQLIQNKAGLTPGIKVVYKGKTLEEGKDVKVTYSNNKAVGTAKVTVKGIGNYAGELKNVLSFTIVQKELSDDTIHVVAEDLKYNVKNSYKAKLAVYDNGVKLSSSEYKIKGITEVNTDKETQCGTVKVAIEGKKNYSGSIEIKVQIRKTLLSSAKASVNGNYYYAVGVPVCPLAENLTVTIGSGKNKVTLEAGKDFEITQYTNNTKAGKATLTIHGLGEYGGTKKVTYTILKKAMK